MRTSPQFRTRSAGNLGVVDLEGDLTHASEAALVAALHAPAIAGRPRVLLNFEHVGYINSAGISLLVSTIVEMRTSGRQLMACHLSPHYTKVFRMVGLREFLPLFNTESEAVAALDSSK